MKIGWPVVFILCLFKSHVAYSQEFRAVHHILDENKEYGFALIGFVLRSFVSSTYALCWLECEQEKQCKSFNYDMTTTTCELNTRTKNSEPENYKSKTNSIYCPWTLSTRKSWIKVNADPVCFGAKGDQFGRVLIKPKRGFVDAVKLTHLSGGLTCRPFGKLTKWGCDEALLFTIFTDKNNNRLAPQDRWITNWRKLAYKIEGYDSSLSTELFMKLKTSLNITAGQEYRLWYGEDLKNDGDSDNSGTACVNVYLHGVF